MQTGYGRIFSLDICLASWIASCYGHQLWLKLKCVKNSLLNKKKQFALWWNCKFLQVLFVTFPISTLPKGGFRSCEHEVFHFSHCITSAFPPWRTSECKVNLFWSVKSNALPVHLAPHFTACIMERIELPATLGQTQLPIITPLIFACPSLCVIEHPAK